MNQEQYDNVINKIDQKSAEIEQGILFQQKIIIVGVVFQLLFLGVILGFLLSKFS